MKVKKKSTENHNKRLTALFLYGNVKSMPQGHEAASGVQPRPVGLKRKLLYLCICLPGAN